MSTNQSRLLQLNGSRELALVSEPSEEAEEDHVTLDDSKVDRLTYGGGNKVALSSRLRDISITFFISFFLENQQWPTITPCL